MLQEDWEVISTEIANKATPEDVSKYYHEIAAQQKADLEGPARVVVARDTRASGSRLLGCLLDGLKATGAEVKEYGFLTTPQLHYMVRCLNTEGTKDAYGTPTEKGYYEKFGTAFKTALKGKKPAGSLTVDCANGVGGPKLTELIKHLPPKEEGLEIFVINDNVIKPESLNVDVRLTFFPSWLDKEKANHVQCGADFVKTNQRAPPSSKAGPGDRCASLDGDADRVVYYFKDSSNVFRLLDGDRIATLAANFLGELVSKAGLAEKITIGVVQTAYANGASSKYVAQVLDLKSEFTPTGVKHLHHAATRYDIGVYFEANGHGTILFSNKALNTIWSKEPESPAQLENLEVLRAATELINQTVGDAISDFLLVEAILAHKEYTVKEWITTYNDKPNKLAKQVVKHRDEYKTVPGTAEQKLASPAGLQEKIDAEVAKYRDGRCFVRASGTEDAVRVYCEAAEVLEVENMVQSVSQLVQSQS